MKRKMKPYAIGKIKDHSRLTGEKHGSMESYTYPSDAKTARRDKTRMRQYEKGRARQQAKRELKIMGNENS